MTTLPQGLRISLSMYLVSDSSGINTGIGACNAKQFNEEDLACLINATIKTANELVSLTDFRAMTDAEIEDYLITEEEES